MKTHFKIVGLTALLSLMGCGDATKPEIQTQIVNVPVSVPCKPTVNPNEPPAFPANDVAMRSLPFPGAAAELHANPKNALAKAHVDANVFYLLQLMAADRIETRSWIDRLAAGLKGCM